LGDTGFYDEGPIAAIFLVEVDGQPIGRFTEADGLSVDVAVESIEEGGQNGFVHKVPGRMTWPNLVLKRGMTQSDNLIDWLNKSSGEGFTAANDKLTRSTAAITMMSSSGKRLRSWEIEGAFPVKWSGPKFAADATTAVDETLEIAHHGFKSAKPS
jgi:phage tail-like protein